MKCPYCGSPESKVVDSRPAESRIKRRRECLGCEKRFTTYEEVEHVPLVVVKKDGKTRQLFEKEKLLNSLLKACNKRPVPVSVLEKAVDEIESELLNCVDGEIISTQIGELAMQKLRQIDEIAYVRFASVYRQFKDVSTFMEEIQALLSADAKREKSEKH